MTTQRLKTSDFWPMVGQVVENLSGANGAEWFEALKRFLRKENPWPSVGAPTGESAKWREHDGVIYLQVTSDGTTGAGWIDWFEKNNLRVSDYAKSVLVSKDFKPSKACTVYEIAILKGMLFEDKNRFTKDIRAEAMRRNLSKPNAEVACLIRKHFSDADIEAMGLWWIVAMHEPIKGSGGYPSLLGAGRGGGGRWLRAGCGDPDRGWHRGDGFAFVVSQACV